MSELKVAEQAKKEILQRITARISQKHKHNSGLVFAGPKHGAHGSSIHSHGSHSSHGK